MFFILLLYSNFILILISFSFPNNASLVQPLETYNYHKAKEAFRNFKNVTRTISGLSSDESSSVIDNASSSDETTKEQSGLVNGKKDPNLHLLFTSSSVILTSEDEGLGHDDSSRRPYRSEEEAFSGPSSLERESEKQSKAKKSELSADKKSDKSASGRAVIAVDRCTSPLMNVNELEAKLGKLEKQNNDLIEQNLELEEAENDARLMSQKLKIKVDNLLEQIDNLQINLEQSQEFIKSSRCDLNEFKKREDKLLEQIKDLQTKLEDERNISSLSTIDSSEDWKEDKELSMLAALNDAGRNERNNKNNPICNSIKPVKIDLCSYACNEPQLVDSLDNSLDNQINSPINGASESSSCLMSQHSIDSHLKALENNQEELNDRLKHLQTVNREFVRDLEQREHLLTKKELLFKEWITKESLLRRNIAELNNELDELNKQFNVSQRQRAELRAKCEELHLQLTELERGDTLQDDSEQLPLSTRQKEMHELIVNCKQQEYDHRLIELMTQFKMQFDAQVVKDMERTEQTQVILDKFFAQDLELQDEMRQLLSKQNELKERVHKQQKNLEKVSSERPTMVFSFAF